MKIIKQILVINKNICKNFTEIKVDTGFKSQNILNALRDFIEHIFLKIYAHPKDIQDSYENIKLARDYIYSKGELKFLWQLHKFLQISVSHRTFNEENSESLLLKYYEYLLKIKKYLKTKYSIDILYNLNNFLINQDSQLQEYYNKIAEKINNITNESKKEKRYNVEKIKPFFVNNEIFYELTYSEARIKNNKFNRHIAFTKLDISTNYSVKLWFSCNSIEILGNTMSILIITKSEVSLMPNVITKLFLIFGKTWMIKNNNNYSDYNKIMNFLTLKNLNFLQIIQSAEKEFKNYQKIFKNNKIFKILILCKEIINQNKPAANILRYLLHTMKSEILKNQIYENYNNYLSNLFLKPGCIPFDQMPFASSLSKHNPKFFDLLECLDTNERNHEFLARMIKKNTEIKGIIYTIIEDEDIFIKHQENIQKYNQKIYYKHKDIRVIENYKNHLYIKEYEDKTIFIVESLKKLTSSGTKNFTNSVNAWIKLNYTVNIDCEQKKEILTKLFENSKVAFIYGPAGTGKTTLIYFISLYFKSRTKLYLTHTNAALENLRRKIISSDSNSKFLTISKFLSRTSEKKQYDLVIIDECSCVSNKDMYSILKETKFENLLLVGDIYQIESIEFGNWFTLSQKLIETKSIFNLNSTYRTKNKNLLDFWKRVRTNNSEIVEYIAKNDYSSTLDKSILIREYKDEVILCLNYDGLYGINNINKFMQENNPHPEIEWDDKIYKIDDPILFNETGANRFSPIIYNNLKGRIVNIEKFKDKIQFSIEIDQVLDEYSIKMVRLNLVENHSSDTSIIQFSVNIYNPALQDENEEDQSEDIVPFQISYATSIHKAQGLEYDSVKIVITDEIGELITHNIFYTAITRTKENLKIYWTPNVQNKIIKGFTLINSNKDVNLLKSKLKK